MQEVTEAEGSPPGSGTAGQTRFSLACLPPAMSPPPVCPVLFSGKTDPRPQLSVPVLPQIPKNSRGPAPPCWWTSQPRRVGRGLPLLESGWYPADRTDAARAGWAVVQRQVPHLCAHQALEHWRRDEPWEGWGCVWGHCLFPPSLQSSADKQSKLGIKTSLAPISRQAGCISNV